MKLILRVLRDMLDHPIQYAFWFTIGLAIVVVFFDVFVWRK